MTHPTEFPYVHEGDDRVDLGRVRVSGSSAVPEPLARGARGAVVFVGEVTGINVHPFRQRLTRDHTFDADTAVWVPEEDVEELVNAALRRQREVDDRIAGVRPLFDADRPPTGEDATAALVDDLAADPATGSPDDVRATIDELHAPRALDDLEAFTYATALSDKQTAALEVAVASFEGVKIGVGLATDRLEGTINLSHARKLIELDLVEELADADGRLGGATHRVTPNGRAVYDQTQKIAEDSGYHPITEE